MTPGAEAALLRRLERLHAEAGSLRVEGRYQEAAAAMESLCQRSAELGPSHPYHLARLVELGELLYMSGSFAAARAVYSGLVAQRRENGVRDVKLAELLAKYAELWRETGDLAKAEELSREALGIYGATRRRRDLNHAFVLINLGRICLDAGKLPQAGTFLRRALRSMRSLVNIPPEYQALYLGTLALLHRDKGQYGRAVKRAEEALSVIRAAFGSRSPQAIVLLANLGVFLSQAGETARATTVMREALDLYREVLGSSHPKTANAMTNLARLLVLHTDFGEAEELITEALEVYQQMGDAARLLAGNALNGLAHLRYAQGRFAEADRIYAELITELEREGAAGQALLLGLLHNHAQVVHETGDLARARALYERVARILRRKVGVNHIDYARTLFNLAGLHQEIGDTRGALKLTMRVVAVARKFLGELHPELAGIVASLGSLHASRGNFKDAAAAYGEAFRIHHAAGTLDSVNGAAVLKGMAVVFGEQGEHAQAELLNHRVLQIRRATLGPSHPAVGESLMDLAVSHHAAGRFTEGAVLARRALNIVERAVGPTHPQVARYSYNLAFMLAAQGRHAAALRVAIHAEERFDRTMHAVLAAASERQLIGFLETARLRHDTFLSLVFLAKGNSRGAPAAADLVLRRKGITAEVLAAQRANARVEHGSAATGLESLTALRLRIARKTLDGAGAEGPAAHRRLLAAWEEERDQLEAELAAYVPDLRLERQLRAADWHAVAGALPPGAALVEVAQYLPVVFSARPALGESQVSPSRYLALVIRSGEPSRVKLVDLGAAERIDATIARFRAASRRGARELGTERDDVDDSDRTGHWLRSALLDPLLPALRGLTRLFVAPDGDLALLPWETLPLDDRRRVIDEFRVSYLTTGRDLLRMAAPRGGRSRSSVVVAAPDYDLPTRDEEKMGEITPLSRKRTASGRSGRQSGDLRGTWFEPLASTSEEGMRIAELLGVAPLLGPDALEARVKEIRSPAILHIATHGFFLAARRRGRGSSTPAMVSAHDQFGRLGRVQNPLLRSGLALAGANRWLRGLPLPPEAEDGLLTAEDVSALELDATELVVLSACDTGVGRTLVGEGVFGLRRAFVVAGVKTLVTSLWSVPDAQTRELMEDFYRRLLSGTPRAEALREAQGDPSPLPVLGQPAEEPR